MSERFFFLVGGTGGGASTETFRVELWKYILAEIAHPSMIAKVGLLTTPSKLTANRIDIDLLVSNYEKLQNKIGCEFTLIDEQRFGAGEYDEQIDALCITCGNTSGAREIWQTYGCEDVISRWHTNGVPIIGYSAGFIIFYEWASTDSVPSPVDAEFGVMPCMGLLKGAAIPHADTQSRRIPDFQKVLVRQPIFPAIALGEDTMAVYDDDQLQRIVSPLEKPIAAWLSANDISPITVERIPSSLSL